MESIDTDTAELDRALAPYGRMNFYLTCSVAGRPAQMTMNHERVFLAVHAVGVEVVSAPFAEVGWSGSGITRRVRFAERTLEVDFPDESSAARFARVLDVRQTSRPGSAPVTVPPAGEAFSSPAPFGALGLTPSPLQASPERKYAQYAQWVMAASGALIVLGVLDLIAGVILGLVLLATGGGVFALAWLLFAVLGSAGPFCLAFLARMIVYRDRAAAARPV